MTARQNKTLCAIPIFCKHEHFAGFGNIGVCISGAINTHSIVTLWLRRIQHTTQSTGKSNRQSAYRDSTWHGRNWDAKSFLACMLLDTVLSSGMLRDAERVLLNNTQVHRGGTRGEPTQTDTGRTMQIPHWEEPDPGEHCSRTMTMSVMLKHVVFVRPQC